MVRKKKDKKTLAPSSSLKVRDSISMPKLEEEDREIKKRMHEIQSDKVKTLTREKTFKGVL